VNLYRRTLAAGLMITR